jgi:hypothetical protein
MSRDSLRSYNSGAISHSLTLTDTDSSFERAGRVHVCYKLQSVEIGLRRERPGLSSCDFGKSFRSPELFHLLDFGHLGIMRIDLGVLRTLGGSKCCVRAPEDHPGQDQVGEGHRV